MASAVQVYNMKNIITLDIFKKVISNIKKMEEDNDKLTEILVCKESTGWCSFGDTIVDCMVELLTKTLKDETDMLNWWLYDISDGNKYIYEKINDKEEIVYNLNEIEDLYNYMVGDLHKVKQELKPIDKTKICKTEEVTMEELKALLGYEAFKDE